LTWKTNTMQNAFKYGNNSEATGVMENDVTLRYDCDEKSSWNSCEWVERPRFPLAEIHAPPHTFPNWCLNCSSLYRSKILITFYLHLFTRFVLVPRNMKCGMNQIRLNTRHGEGFAGGCNKQPITELMSPIKIDADIKMIYDSE
jgi:hypothetical protein